MAYSKPMPPPGHIMTNANVVCYAPIYPGGNAMQFGAPMWLEKLKLHMPYLEKVIVVSAFTSFNHFTCTINMLMSLLN